MLRDEFLKAQALYTRIAYLEGQMGDILKARQDMLERREEHYQAPSSIDAPNLVLSSPRSIRIAVDEQELWDLILEGAFGYYKEQKIKAEAEFDQFACTSITSAESADN